MATRRLVSFVLPFEKLTGKYARVKDKVSKKNPGFKWCGGVTHHRNVLNTSSVFRIQPRTSAYSTEELAKQTKFGAVAKALSAVYKNPAAYQTAVAEFQAQSTYKYLRDYIWHREWANYQPE